MMKYASEIVQNDLQQINSSAFLSRVTSKSKVMITGCNGMIATYLLYYFLFYFSIHCNDFVKRYPLDLLVLLFLISQLFL